MTVGVIANSDLFFNLLRAKFAHGVLSGRYSQEPEKETQETTEQQVDRVCIV